MESDERYNLPSIATEEAEQKEETWQTEETWQEEVIPINEAGQKAIFFLHGKNHTTAQELFAISLACTGKANEAETNLALNRCATNAGYLKKDCTSLTRAKRVCGFVTFVNAVTAGIMTLFGDFTQAAIHAGVAIGGALVVRGITPYVDEIGDKIEVNQTVQAIITMANPESRRIPTAFDEDCYGSFRYL